MIDNKNINLNMCNHDDQSSAGEKKRTRKPFTDKEDQKLRRLVRKFGEVNAWAKIADKMKGRNVRQCRERWVNTLSEKVTKSKWTDWEDNVLMQKYEEYGPKWKKMESFFPGRIQYQIRNRFKALARIHQQNKLNNEIDSLDYLFNDSDEITKKIESPNIEKTENTKNESFKNIFTFFPILENQKKGEKVDIFQSRLNLDEDAYDYENYWNNLTF